MCVTLITHNAQINLIKFIIIIRRYSIVNYLGNLINNGIIIILGYCFAQRRIIIIKPESHFFIAFQFV